MGLLSGITSFIGGLANAVTHAFQPQQSRQPQKPQPNAYDLGTFLQTHVANPVVNTAKQIPKIHLQGIEQLTGKPYNVGNAYNDLIQKPVINPAIRGGVALTTMQENTAAGRPVLQGINVKQLAGDTLSTGLNFERPAAAVGKATLKAAAPIVRAVAQEAQAGFPTTLASQAGRVNLSAPLEVPKPPLPVAAATQAAKAAQAAPVKLRGLTESVKASPEVSPETQSLVQAAYTPKSNKVLIANAGKLMASRNGGLKSATTAVDTALASPAGKIADQDVANAIAVAKAHDAKGNFEDASRIYDKLAEHLTESGRNVQAASLLARRTPQGLLYSAQKTLKQAGVEVTGDLKSSLQKGLAAVKATKEGSPERDYAIAQFQKMVSKNIPSSMLDKIIGTWKAGLLTGVKTQTGNALSNATFDALKTASNPLAATIDKGLSLVTGQRTKTFTLKGKASGAVEGLQKAGQYLKSGIDERNLAGKYEQKELNFKNPVLRTYVNGVFRMMGAADRPTYYANLRNNLADLGKAEGLNQGLKGAKLKAFVKDSMTNPSEKAFQTATDAAEKAVLANETLGSKVIGSIRNAVGDSPAGKIALNVVAPFTKVPSAFISRVFDFTPVGPIKTVVSQIRKGKFDQRALSEALAEATTGSSVMYLGAELANGGLLSGDYPQDPKEQARWKAEGITPNSIKVGNQWLSLNYFGPMGALFGIGKNVTDVAKSGGAIPEQLSSAIAGAAKTTLNQSFLQGVSGVLDAVNDPKRYAQNYVKNQTASVIPTIVGDVAKATDPLQRQTNSTGDALVAKLPGARQSLMPQQDAFGNQLTAAAEPGDLLANPLRPSQSRSTPLTKELDRLGQAGQSIFPTPDKSLQVGKEQVKMNPEQSTSFNKAVGQQVQKLWEQITTSQDYQQLADDKKKQALQSALDDVRAVQKKQQLDQMGRGDLADKVKLSSRQAAMAGGSTVLSDYLTTGSTPKDTYTKAAAKYKEDKSTGRLTAVGDYKAQQRLVRLKVESAFSQDVLDLYGLSRKQREALIAQKPDLAKLLPQVQQLDQTMSQSTGGKLRVGASKQSKTYSRLVSKLKSPKPKLSSPKVAKFSTPKPVKLKTSKPKLATRKAGKGLRITA